MLLAITSPAALAHNEAPRQREARMMTFNAESSVMIDEGGFVVVAKDGTLEVDFVAPASERPKENAGLDVRRGDEIGMAGGRKVSTIKELRAVYDSAKTGETFRMGLRRDGSSFVISFAKADASNKPRRRMMVRTEGDAPGEGVERDILPALGIALELRGGKVVVTGVFPNGPKGMAKGDELVSLNGKPVKNLDDFNAVYDPSPEGAELRFVLLRGGKETTVVAKRTRPDVEVKVQ